MNRNHRFFYQVQGQLNITERDYCVFTVWTPKSLKMMRVKRDELFWQKEMLPLLTCFCYECMLPEILDSCYNRHMLIREPQYTIKAKEAKDRQRNSQEIEVLNIDSENLEQSIPKTKHLKRNVSPKKESSVTLNTEQDTKIK